jgi:hypothetical protein
MHGNSETGFAFPASCGQGKMFAPFNVRTAWAGDRIIMLHGATYNGAFDSVGNCRGVFGIPEYGPLSERAVEHGFQLYQGTAASGRMRESLEASEDGYLRRGATIDNPARYVSGTKQSQYSTGRAWSCVTWWGGWDREPISDPDGTTIGMDTLDPMMGDTWSCQYGIPHENAAGARANNYNPSLSNWDDAATLRFFNIIGPGTPFNVYDDGAGQYLDFYNSAQSIMCGMDTRNMGSVLAGSNGGASSSFWSAKMDLNFAASTGNASDWNAERRWDGHRALDWSMDHVAFRLNFVNDRSTNVGTGVSSFHYFASNWGLDLNGYSRFASYAFGASAGGFSVMPDRYSPIKGCNIWGAPEQYGETSPGAFAYGTTTKDLGRFTSLGNGSLISWVVSVPHRGLRAGSGVDNFNTPFTGVGGGSGWRFAAMQVSPIMEDGGIHSGGRLYYGDVCVAMGVNGGSDIAVLVDQLDGTEVIKDSINLSGEGFGSAEKPIFWEFRLTMKRNDSNELRVRLFARQVGTDTAWLKTSTCTMSTRRATSNQSNLRYLDQQTAAWGIIDATPATNHEYLAMWREFNVSYYGCGSRWNVGTMDNPGELPGLVCAPTPVYVTNNIYARWGGGGGFIGDQFAGTIDHSYAVENIFTPSPYTKWKTDSSANSETHPMAYDSISFSVDPVTAASATSVYNQQRSAATWLALYGVQDRSILVDVSFKRDFKVDQTVTYKASSLLTTVNITDVQDNVISYEDGLAAGANNGAFKEGDLAGKYIGWQATETGYTRSYTAKILTNRYSEIAGTGLLWIDPLSLSPGMSIHGDSLSGDYGLGSGPGITADLWSDRCAIDLLSLDSRIAAPAGYGATAWRRGFSFLRLRFPGDGSSPVGTVPFLTAASFGNPGYHTIDGKHTLGTMILGRGVNFDVPLNWEHGDGTTPNVKIETAPSGQKQSYKMSPPRRSVSFNMPGDINSFRHRLQNMLDEYTSYTQKPVALLLQTDSSTTLADDRFNILARYSGSFENANVGWKRDENNVWVPIGDTTLKFDEEL